MPSTGDASAKPPDAKQPSVDSRKPSMNLRPPIEAVNCPRCDSPNTKFCYYNNYSLTQPRYFCKTCRRYWTKGGALRSVPVGGGCRKKKKTKLPSAPSLLVGHFSGLNSPNAGGFSQLCSFGGFQYTPATSLCSALDASAASTTSLEVFNHSLPTAPIQELSSGVGGMIQDSMASSIESLRSINQELHWKLQQKRLAMFSSASNSLTENHPQQKQSISFQTDVNANELVLENSYGVIDGSSNSAINGWNDMQTWNDSHQYYTALR